MPTKRKNDDDGEEQYEVEKILSVKTENKKPKYLVKWKGYPIKQTTWEPEEHLTHIREYIEEFEKTVLPQLPLNLRKRTDSTPYFDAEKINQERVSETDKSKKEYLIQWKHFPIATWEPEDTVPRDVLKVFQTAKRKAEKASTPVEDKKRKRTTRTSAKADDKVEESNAKSQDKSDDALDSEQRPKKRLRRTVSKKDDSASEDNKTSDKEEPTTPPRKKTTTATRKKTPKKSPKPTPNKTETPSSKTATPPATPAVVPTPSQEEASISTPLATEKLTSEHRVRVDGAKKIHGSMQMRIIWLDRGTTEMVPFGTIRYTHPQEVIDFLMSRLVTLDKKDTTQSKVEEIANQANIKANNGTVASNSVEDVPMTDKGPANDKEAAPVPQQPSASPVSSFKPAAIVTEQSKPKESPQQQRSSSQNQNQTSSSTALPDSPTL